MSDQNANIDPKEATEARLCAYLEGELSPVEKIEIEQHLAANPQHRQLLVDLARTREWMRSVPRETSPVDLGEMFQGHVERKMLLDDSTDNAGGMSINRWPQYVLVAAITMLTIGLGVVLVAILKSPNGQGTASTSVLGPRAGSSVDHTVASTTLPAETRDAKSLADAMPPSDAPVKPAAPGAGQAGALDDAAHEKYADNPFKARGTADEIDALKSRLTAAGIRLPADQKTVCFVVTADSPPAAMEQLRGFFDRHQIVFNGPPAGPSYASVGGRGGFGNARIAEAENNQAPGLHNSARMVQNSGTNNAAGSLNEVQQNSQQPVQNAANNQDMLPGANTGDKARQNLAQIQTQQNLTPFASSAPTAGETIFVAPNMTPLELELLNASLAGDALKQSVDRVTLAERPQAQASLAPGEIAPGLITRGTTMTVTIPQLIGPGIEKTNVVKVGEDGTISLPMIDPVSAAGVAPAELQTRIADKYREANLIDSATVTIAVAAAPPSSSPGTQPAEAAARLATPATKAATAAPGTQPAVDPSFVDVVVVIQPSKLPATGMLPAPGK
jgi:anti-sigma factor RsiW